MGPILPQNRKYLCQAPRPESWKELSKHVLSEIGRTEIVATIERIQTLHSIEPRLGPGRKSNAEHALQFYRYLLQEIDDEDTEDDDSSDDDGAIIDPPEPKPRSTECEICTLSTAPLIPCDSCHLIFHPDCLRPKVSQIPESPWRCAYCIMADRTIKRTSRVRKQATASVRQLARLKNQFERERMAAAVHGKPETDAYDKEEDRKITETTVTTDAEASKVLDTTAVTKDNEASVTDAGNIDAKEVPEEKPEMISNGPPSTTATEEPALNKSEAHDETTKAAATNIDLNRNDAKAGNGADDDDTTKETKEPTAEEIKEKEEAAKREMELGPSSPARTRRNRKQPTLYDPQIGPASQWSSDGGITRPSASTDDEEDDDETEDDASLGKNETTKESIRRQLRDGDAEDSLWCNFCRDRSDIPLCVFCGCRLCFGKHDKDKMNSCADCHEEYHAACLLVTTEDAKKDEANSPWRCPACLTARKAPKRTIPSRIKSRDAEASSISSSNPSRRSTRTPIQRRPLPMAEPAVPITRDVERKPAPTKPTGRPRGRPPKNASAASVSSTQSSVPAPTRKRGRPPSNPQGGPPRKRGRPPSAATLARRAEEEEQRRRQRLDVGTLDEMEVESMGISPAVTVSRSGRTVKRSTFHDEIEEGAQFLKSSKNRQSPKTGPLSSDVPIGLEDSGEMLLDSVTDPSLIDLSDDVKPAAFASLKPPPGTSQGNERVPPRRKPGARECMQMSRRFGAEVISDKYMDILTDYCSRGKVEHLIRMRERLDEHSRFLESQLAGLEALVLEKGESDVVVPLVPQRSE